MSSIDDDDGRHEPPSARAAARRDAFLNAATTVFLEHGYEAANVNDIVRISGGSLATLYAHFGNKEGIFSAVIERMLDRFKAALDRLCMDGEPLEIGLQRIGLRYLEQIVDRQNATFFRIAISISATHPVYFHRLRETILASIAAPLANYLVTRCRIKGFALPDPFASAQFFLALVGARYSGLAIGDVDYKPDPEALAAHVRAAASLFCHGIKGAEPRRI